jgi:hypothetical protein
MSGEGSHIIHTLLKKWTGKLLLVSLLMVIAAVVFVSSVSLFILHLPVYLTLLIMVLVAGVVFRCTHRKINTEDISAYLNRSQPYLEESAGLVLQPYDNLNLLQKLQIQRIAAAMSADIAQPAAITRKMQQALLLLVLAVVIGTGLYFLPSRNPDAATIGSLSAKPEKKLPEVDKAVLTIIPPSYTGKKTREQDRFNVTTDEGARLLWKINTNMPVKEMRLVFNDKSSLVLRSIDNEHTQWSAEKTITQPGFYQLSIDGSLSELYQVEMLRDQPPGITVQSPKPNTLIEPWMPMQSQVQVAVTDDYGIKNAFIAATISTGTGEAVKFKQTTIAFPGFAPGSSRYQLQKLINLRALDMNKGDELYFYVSATDSKGQEKKSDMYIVRIEDTAKLMSIEGLASGLDLKVDFFRSQRQIIIETEQLLRDKDTMSVADFRKKSNNLGIDQKLLRMRYSKFLGEETNAEIGETGGEDHGDDDHSGDQSQELLSAVTHNHDNAEDATFFDPETKKQLQLTLAEMWKAELKLRTMYPKEALPFEYAALRLLKELQQSSRAYVAKTGVKTAPLKLEKRLTGDLDKITPFTQQQNIEPAETGSLLRKALGIIEEVRNKEELQPASQNILEQAGIEFSRKAAEEPSSYLPAYEAYRRILQKKHSSPDLDIAAKAIQKIVAATQKQPFRNNTHTDMNLSQRYFNHLKRSDD